MYNVTRYLIIGIYILYVYVYYIVVDLRIIVFLSIIRFFFHESEGKVEHL